MCVALPLCHMARLRSARLAKAADNAATDTKVPSGTELTVQAGTKEPCQAVQVGSKEPCAAELTVQAGSKEPCVAELALQTALKMKERIRNNVVAREVGIGLDVSNLQREPDVLTLESNKSSGMSKLRRCVAYSSYHSYKRVSINFNNRQSYAREPPSTCFYITTYHCKYYPFI